MAELKPCPFCGGKARSVLYHNRELTWVKHYVKCEQCLSCTATYPSVEIANKAWNRRAEDGETRRKT